MPDNQEPLSSESTGEITKDDIVDILSEEEQPKPEKDKGDKKEDKKEDKDELELGEEGDEDDEDDEDDEEDEDEGSEEDEEERILQLEDQQIEIPRKKEILKAFPDLFKKFPSIESAIYRDRQFSEIFPTPEEARDAAEKSQQFDHLGNDLYRGNSETLLKTIKEGDENAFYRLTDNFIDNVGKVDQRAYHNIIGNIVKYTIIAMSEEAKANQDSELMEHAAALNKFVFRSDKFTPPQKIAREPGPQDREFDRERVQFARERFESARDDLQGKVDNLIKATISRYIDPKGEMTSFVKKHASAEAFSKLETVLANDRILRSTLDRLWREANEGKYSKPLLDKIQAAYLSKAKANLRDTIRSARIEALSKGSRRRESGENDSGSRKRGHIPVGRQAGSSGGKGGKMQIPKGMSNKDFIMSD